MYSVPGPELTEAEATLSKVPPVASNSEPLPLTATATLSPALLAMFSEPPFWFNVPPVSTYTFPYVPLALAMLLLPPLNVAVAPLEIWIVPPSPAVWLPPWPPKTILLPVQLDPVPSTMPNPWPPL